MTSTDKIPEDVQRASGEVARAYLEGGDEGPTLHVLVARAIMAERERAWLIAIGWQMDDDEAADHVVLTVNGTCKRIASAIRGGR